MLCITVASAGLGVPHAKQAYGLCWLNLRITMYHPTLGYVLYRSPKTQSLKGTWYPLHAILH